MCACLPGTTGEYSEDKRHADSSSVRPLLGFQTGSGRYNIYLNLPPLHLLRLRICPFFSSKWMWLQLFGNTWKGFQQWPWTEPNLYFTQFKLTKLRGVQWAVTLDANVANMANVALAGVSVTITIGWIALSHKSHKVTSFGLLAAAVTYILNMYHIH